MEAEQMQGLYIRCISELFVVWYHKAFDIQHSNKFLKKYLHKNVRSRTMWYIESSNKHLSVFCHAQRKHLNIKLFKCSR